MQKQFNYDCHHWGANKKVMEVMNKRKKNPETLQLIERRNDINKPGSHRFKFDSSLNRKVWVPRRPNRRRRDEVAEFDLELFFRNSEKNRWTGRYFEFNEPEPGSSNKKTNIPEQNTIEPEPILGTEKIEVVKSPSNFPVVDLEDYGLADKAIQYFQIKHVIDKPKTNSAEGEENLKKSEFNFMITLKTLIHKISIDPKLLQLKVCVRNNKKDRASEELASVYSEIFRMIWFVIRRGQDCNSRRTERTGGERITLQTPGLNKDACLQQHILVARNEEKH